VIRRYDHPAGSRLQCSACLAKGALWATHAVDARHIFPLSRVAHDCDLGTWVLPPQLKPVRSGR